MITGHISDRVPVRWILPLWCSVAAAGCLLLWGFGTSSGPLVAFSIVWGMSGASVAGTYGKMVTIMAGESCRERSERRARPPSLASSPPS